MWDNFKRECRERFLWVDTLGYLNLVIAGVLGFVFQQYTFHLFWLYVTVYGLYKFFNNPVKKKIKMEKLIKERKEADKC